MRIFQAMSALFDSNRLSTITLGSGVILLLTGLVNIATVNSAVASAGADSQSATSVNVDDLTEADIGKMLFFDTSLSLHRNMSCSTCHDPEQGFSDQRLSKAHGIVSQGSNGELFGVRNTPTITYASSSPTFHFDANINEFVGGQFWDGRSSNQAQQSMGPPLDANEMAMPSAVDVVKRLQENPIYEQAFKDFYGDDIFNIQDSYSKYRKLSDPKEMPNAFIAMGNFIQAFEKTDYFSPFDSKYDRYLKGQYKLTADEEAGRKLFFEDAQVNCRSCHLQKQPGDEQEVFTSHRYRNVGVPANQNLIALHPDNLEFIDLGAMNNTFMAEDKFKGKFKIPTLRNIAITKPYMHNGVFNELRTAIEFFDHYNNPARKINPETNKPWEVPEVTETIDKKELKGRALSDQEIDQLVAFFKTLTDKRYEDQLVQANK